MSILYKKLAKWFPALPQKLKQAKLPFTPEQYVQRNFVMSVFLSIFISLIIFLFTTNPLFFLAVPLILPVSLFYFMGYADLKVEKAKKAINREIVYAGRFLIIELESGVPLYEAFQNLRNNYDELGKYFGDIVRDVDFGTSMEDAIENGIVRSPSPQLRKILWQVLNSLRTGADIKSSLASVLDQIVREQQIEMKEYGRKLNPMAMFYMMMAIIVPSLGTTMLVVMATFIGFGLPMSVLLLLVGLLGFFQFMFFAYIRSSRPPMAL